MKIGDRVKLISSLHHQKCKKHIGKYGSIVYGCDKNRMGTTVPGDEIVSLNNGACVKIDNEDNPYNDHNGFWYHIEDLELEISAETISAYKALVNKVLPNNFKQNESEEKNMMIQNEKGTIERTAHCEEILNLWKINSIRVIRNWEQEKGKKILSQDKIISTAAQYSNEIIFLIENEYGKNTLLSSPSGNFIGDLLERNGIATKETKKILDLIHTVQCDYDCFINCQHKEILTLLKATENYEQEQEILKAYDIIRDSGKMRPIYLTSELNHKLNEKLEASKEGDTDVSE